MSNVIFGFECPHGFVNNYEACEQVNKPECEKCRSKAKLISETLNGCFIGKWISVKDRLPEETEDVLVYAEWELAGINDVSRNSGIRIGWQIDGRWHIDSKCRVKALYWMPLPQPPKEG